MTTTHTETSAAEAALLEIDLLGPNTDAGFAAAVKFGKSLVSRIKETNWNLGDLAVKVAPAVPARKIEWAKAFPSSAEAEDVKRLRDLADAIDVDIDKLHDLHKVARAFPDGVRHSDVKWSVYNVIAPKMLAGEDVGGVPAGKWIQSFRDSRGHWPKFVDAREAVGQKARVTSEIGHSSTKTKVEVVTTLIETEPEVRAAIQELMTPSLDGGAAPSATLALDPKVLGVETVLSKAVTILVQARDDVDIIAASSSSDYIATLAQHVAREAQALADILLLDPSKA